MANKSAKNAQAQANEAQVEQPSVEASLEELQEYLTKGLITQADYEAKKKQILGL